MNEKNENLRSPQQFHERIVALLPPLRDADMCAQDMHVQKTPLHESGLRGDVGIAMLLLEHRANVDVRDQNQAP